MMQYLKMTANTQTVEHVAPLMYATTAYLLCSPAFGNSFLSVS